MSERQLYLLLQPESIGGAARIFRPVHHAMAAVGIGIMLADTAAPWPMAARSTPAFGCVRVLVTAAKAGVHSLPLA